METVKKSCSNCYWGTGKFVDAAHTVCKECDHQSGINDPFPEWLPISPDEEYGFRGYGFKPGPISEMVQKALDECPEDVVNHPKHYTKHASGIECIQITEHMNFCLGNAMKYIWRAGDKHETPIEDLKKAKWYIEREIARLEKE